MLTTRALESFLKNQYSHSIIDQASLNKYERLYRTFHFDLNFLYLIKNQLSIMTIVVGNYPLFIKTFQKVINEVLISQNIIVPEYGSKISLQINNCTIPKHDLKSTQFLMASLHQTQGTLIYLKDVEIVQSKQIELYLQSWNEIWEFKCQCQKDKLMKKKISQSLLQIITKGSKSLKDSTKGQQPQFCSQCQLHLKFLGIDELTYDQCQQIEIILPNLQNYVKKIQLFNIGNLKMFVDKLHLQKFKKGDIIDLCCYLKTSIDLNRSFNNKVSAEITYTTYLVCSYPSQYYLTSSNNMFFGKLCSISLQQKPITNISNIADIIYNYKNIIETINCIKFPYLQQNTLTAFKLVTICSIFGHQANNEKLNLLIISDQVSLIEKCLLIPDISIKKFPSVYDEKTLPMFFNSCHNSILLFTSPSSQKDFNLINKILKNQLYTNLNFVLWIVCEPEQGLKKKIQIKQIQIVLDLTMQKNLNVCESVYVTMIDNYLESFMQDDQDQFIATAVKKFKNLPFGNQSEQIWENQILQGDLVKQDRLANDILKRYFLKSREYKTTKINGIEILSEIAEAFMQFRYFIQNKKLKMISMTKNERHYLSIIDVVLAIFIDEQTSRNKFSSNNTLFSTDVSKIMLNQNNCNVSVWDYEIQDGYMEQNKKFIPRDQLVGMVIGKIFNLIYEDENPY